MDYAQRHGEPQKVSMRVGGDLNEIWIDLGRREWNAVRIAAKGWRVVPHAGVPFVRTVTMLPLPLPQHGGSIQDLRKVLNVRAEDFVLVTAWLLQALNPIGDYPFINVHGESEVGKTFMCNIILRTVDPRTTELRKLRRIEDLLISAKNNWISGIRQFQLDVQRFRRHLLYDRNRNFIRCQSPLHGRRGAHIYCKETSDLQWHSWRPDGEK